MSSDDHIDHASLAQLNNNNAQKEYYLTDIIEFANKDKVEVAGIKAETETSIQGINSMEELIQTFETLMTI